MTYNRFYQIKQKIVQNLVAYHKSISEKIFFSTRNNTPKRLISFPQNPLPNRHTGFFIFFARTTFAWFTSKDEVTNRLSAQADYGVSIVESFTPPKNWVPGQEINKDVYAVNTGNIDAFVEEEVSGVVTFTYETLVEQFGVSGVNYEKLNNDSLKAAQAMEAGGYLIWNNAGVANGPVGTDFEATAPGDYIFRRAIDAETDNGGSNVTAEKYTLEGYHFDGTDYYKIRIAGNNEGDLTNAQGNIELGQRNYVTVNAAGELTTTPVIQYYTLSEVTGQPVSLKYVAAGNYLEATYKTAGPAGAAAPTTTYAVDAETAQKIVDYANIVALHDGRQALIDLGTAQITAQNTVKDAADTVATKAGAYADAYYAIHNATNGTQTLATAAGLAVYNYTDSTIYTQGLATAPTQVATNTDVSGGDKVIVITADDVDASTLGATAKTNVKKAITNYNTAEGTFNAKKAALTAAIDALHTVAIQAGTETEANVAALQEAFDTAANEYYAAAVALKDAYANIQTQVQDSGLLDNTAASQSVANLTTFVNQAKKMSDTGIASTDGTDGDYRNNLDYLIDAYETAAHDNEAAYENLNTKYEAYKTACADYRTAKTNAETDYDTAVSKFDTDKLKSRSTDELTAASFDDVVAAYVIEVTDTADPKAEENVTVEYTGDGADVEATYDKATLARTYNVATATTALTPMLTGTTNTDWSGTAITDTDYQGTVAELTTNQGTSDNNASQGAAAGTANAVTYTVAKDYLDDLEADAAAALDEAALQAIRDAANAEHTIKIKINLADGVADATNPTWSQFPVANGENVAHFYLNKVLEAGETSDMLIDSVELDGESTTPATFKDMTFDLNVALKSAQVTYDEDNNIVETAADSTFTNAEVTNIDQTTKAVTWAAKA